MALTRPGTYVLYKGIGEPLWPGIVYADDMAPPRIQRSRPSGYVTLVLLPGEPLQFKWAGTSQISPYLPLNESNIAPQSDQQRSAWEHTDHIKDAGLNLEYWRDEVDSQLGNGASQTPSSSKIANFEPKGLVCDGDEDDAQLQQVLQMSREACYRNPAALLTPSSSPPQRSQQGRSPQDTISIDSDEDSLYSKPLRRVSRFSPKRVRPSRQRLDVEPSSSDVRKRIRSRSPQQEMSTQSKKQRPSFSGLDQLLGQTSLGQRSSAPTSDTIEGDNSESKDFIRVLVGPERTILTFQKKHVWDKPYFQDSRSGTNHFHLDDNGFWELRHPELVNINIEDFGFIAEYLTDEQFGLRHPETTEQKKEAIAQCASAWQTAEKLNMDDLLMHIAEKVEFLEWDNADVLTLAILIYRATGPSFDAHNKMRDWVSSYMAHHYWSFIKDVEIGSIFIKRLRRLPELERDVFVRRGKSLTVGTDLDEDEESEEEGLGDDGDF